jgi:thioredoxin 1
MQNQTKKVVQATALNFEDLKQSLPLLLVDFSANWCSACKMMEPILDKVAGDFSGVATIAKVDVEENASLASQYSIRTIPALLLFKNGELVKRYTGLTPKSVLTHQISSLM